MDKKDSRGSLKLPTDLHRQIGHYALDRWMKLLMGGGKTLLSQWRPTGIETGVVGVSLRGKALTEEVSQIELLYSFTGAVEYMKTEKSRDDKVF